MPTSVLRRYTPPTCTLEIVATGSALSRWTDRTVLKNLRFQLSLDDPKLPPDQQITLRGNRTELEALCAIVGSYVQRLLNQAPEQVALSATAAVSEPLAPEPLPLNLQPPNLQPSEPEFDPSILETGIAMQQQGWLSHELYLGTLANEESGSTVRLSALQLFDLANALDEYNAEALALPAMGRPSWLKSPPQWARIAAVAVLALGATSAVAKFVMDVSNPTIQTAATTREAETSLQQGDDFASRIAVPPELNSPLPPAISTTPIPVPLTEGATKPPTGNTTLPTIPVNPTSPPPAPADAMLPPTVSVDQLPAANDSQSIAVIPAPGVAPAPEVAPAPQADSPEVAAAPPRLAEAGSTAAPETGIALAPSTFSRSAAGQATNEGDSQEAPQTAAANGTAFDTIPQVAEVRSYFQQNWQPPAELTQTLEYRLLLNTDGSLQRIVPLGQMAAQYVDRTSMPLMGEPFVSPTDGTIPQIRVVLKPNGQVQTFLEYAN